MFTKPLFTRGFFIFTQLLINLIRYCFELKNLLLIYLLLGCVHSLAQDLSSCAVIMTSDSNAHKRDSAALVFEQNFPNWVSNHFLEEQVPFKHVSLLIGKGKQKIKFYSWIYIDSRQKLKRYCGYIAYMDQNSNKINGFILSDSSAALINADTAKCNPQRWYGAAYYDISTKKFKGVETHFLLGYRNDGEQIQKLVEPMYLKKGALYIGVNAFKVNKIFVQRFVLSVKSGIKLSLRYYNNGNQIIFDHLSDAGMHGSANKMSYGSGPDGTFDAYEFKKGKWNLIKDFALGGAIKSSGGKKATEEEIKNKLKK